MIFARVCNVVSDPASGCNSEYTAGLRVAVAAVVDFGLAGIEHGERRPIPVEAVAQARRAARSGVSLDIVLRRYILGNTVFGDYIIEEADRAACAGELACLREILCVQSSLLGDLVMAVAHEHTCELQRDGGSNDRRVGERIRMLLAGESMERIQYAPPSGREVDAGVELDAETGYRLNAEHLGVIASGAAAQQVLRAVASALDRRLLCVRHNRETIWAWLAGPRKLRMPDLERALSTRTTRLSSNGREIPLENELVFATGEPAWGLEGWRLTHRQAQAAFLVARRLPRRLTRYGDVALLSAALKDEMLGRSLSDMYLVPLEDSRSGASALRETLRTYLAAECNASSAAAALGVARSTVENRLRTIEARLDRSLHPCPAEIEVALHLDELLRFGAYGYASAEGTTVS